jgi:hypothetical protein
MRRRAVKIISGIVIIILLLIISLFLLVEPWIERKIISAIANIDSDYTIAVDEIDAVFLLPGIEWNGISINSKQKRGIDAKINSIKLKGISLVKFLFKDDLDVTKVIVSGSDIEGKLSFERVKHVISSLNINADEIVFDGLNLTIQDIANNESWVMKDGRLNFYDFELLKRDTFTFRRTGPFDLKAQQLIRVSPDSFYTFKIDNIICSVKENSLQAERFSVLPNYKDYNFTSRHEFQTDCITAEFNHISFVSFSASDYFELNDIIISKVEIDSMDINIFRDRRKKFRHKKKPVLQNILYDYPGKINIDSVHVMNGDVTYTEHGENSKEAGSIRFKKVNADFYHVTNDTVYKKQDAYLEFKSEARLMGAAKITFNLKAKLFDSTNTFFLNGNMSRLDVEQLNPLLERNVFIHAQSGIIDTMYFNLTGDNYSTSGEMVLLYHMLFVKVEAQYAVVPASLMQLLVSSITSRRILDANPMPHEKVRTGVIGFVRDPEKFVFNFYYKSILSGIKSSIDKNQK